jgi:hypothetical protein
MELIERYLKAIEFWLPGGEKQDILAEISEDIHSQIEERETALGRTLTNAELEALLKQRGRPMLVANRYRPQRSLIGPDWFPTYIFVLKIVGLCYVFPWVVICFVIRRIEHPEINWALTLLASLGTAWEVAFFSAAAVTVIFGCLQFTQEKSHFFENWNPRELPAVRDAFKIRRFDSIVEIVVGVAFVLCWIAYAYTLAPFMGSFFKLMLNPVWFDFFWGFLAIGLANIVLAIFNLRRPYWTVPRAACRLASDLAGGALFCWLMKADIVASIWMANLDAAKTAALNHWIQFGMAQYFPVAVILVAIIVVVDAFRIYRVNRLGGAGVANGFAAPAR